MNPIALILLFLATLPFGGAGEPEPNFAALTETWVKQVTAGQHPAAQYHWEASLQLGERFVRGKQAIRAALGERNFQPRDVTVLGHVAQDAASFVSYGTFQTGSGPMLQVTVWKTMMQRHWRVFDIVVPQKTQKAAHRAIIDQARQRWLQHVNGKDATKFVTQMFAKDGRQLYGFDLNEGHAALLDVYRYLDGNDYGITLKAHQLWPVNPKHAVEIGTYKGQGIPSGWYILLWRIEDGQAKIALDFSL